MPVTVKPVVDFSAIKPDIEKIYADLADKDALLEKFAQVQTAGGVYYIATFNRKHIAGATIELQGSKRVLTHLGVHAATRGRGVGVRVLAEIMRLEKAQGTDKLYAIESLSSGEFNSVLREAGFVLNESNSSDALFEVDLS